MNPNEKTVAGLAKTTGLALAAATLALLPKLPAKVPIHFGFDGEVNGWGSPVILLAIAFLGAAISFVMTATARRREGTDRRLILALAIELPLLFASIIAQSASLALGRGTLFPPVLMTVFPAIVLLQCVVAGALRKRTMHWGTRK